MKKFFYSLCLGLGVLPLASQTASAQTMDLEALVFIYDGTPLTVGKAFSPDTNVLTVVNGTVTAFENDTAVYGRYGFWNNGPDTPFVTGDMVSFTGSFSRYLSQHEFDSAQASPGGIPDSAVFGVDRYFWTNGHTFDQTGFYGALYSYTDIFQIIPGDAVYGSGGIGLLADWDLYNQYGPDSFRILGAPFETFENGKEYGFFMRVYGLGGTTPINTDPDPSNNLTVVRIVWNPEGGTSLKVVGKTKATLNLYPNPTTNNVKFNYSLDKNSYTTVVVRDITGRVIKTEKLGTMPAGENQFSVSVESLAAGTYTLEMNTAEITAVGKFTVAK